MAKKAVLKITGMHCASCAMNIDGDLEDLVKGVKSAKTSYAKQECEVEFEEEVKIEQIITQIKETGYQAEVAKSS
ncbi:MAG: cation transporter [Candidatus Levybacteria bacterium]|nr:cation transporter [Candidatus Levybacteria bacterium]